MAQLRLALVFVAAVLFLAQAPSTPLYLPEPPMQRVAWNAPKMPDSHEAFISATKALFDAGFADPRNCEYREIQIRVGSCWSGDGGITKTHGWLIPRQPKDPANKQGGGYAVTWNGLVYPIETLGEKADLNADILALLKADEDARAEHAKRRSDFPFSRHSIITGEGYLVSHKIFHATTACMLLRLGEAELAEKTWQAWKTGSNDKRDLLISFAEDYLWSLYDRAVCSHMYGADALSLASSLQCRAAKTKIEKLAADRGYKEPVENYNKPFRFIYKPHFDVLIADTQRRLISQKGPGIESLWPDPDRQKSTPEFEEGLKNPAQLAATLIERLDQVAARQNGQPGNVQLNWNPIVQQLIAVGKPAVEPLIQCLEQDTRLTRSVSYHRDFFRERHILGVHEAAYAALSKILEQSFLDGNVTHHDLIYGGPEGRKKVATKIRNYWDKNKDIALEDRWFITLADDNASLKQWIDAAKLITSHTAGKGSPPFPLRGEPLRQKANPSVSDLLVKRLKQGSDAFGNDLREAGALARALVAWDGKNEKHLNAIHAYANSLYVGFESVRHGTQNGFNQEYFCWSIVNITNLRVELGDLNALDKYARWVRIVTPEMSRSNTVLLFEPMHKNPDHASIREAAEAMFTGNDSPWAPAVAKSFHHYPIF
ncbi:MAG: hypothetical protein FWD53_13070, partial [Phycisphaerales bacterium]|nr:hypothetical protein [Phycisphaerales bacterium]